MPWMWWLTRQRSAGIQTYPTRINIIYFYDVTLHSNSLAYAPSLVRFLCKTDIFCQENYNLFVLIILLLFHLTALAKGQSSFS